MSRNVLKIMLLASLLFTGNSIMVNAEEKNVSVNIRVLDILEISTFNDSLNYKNKSMNDKEKFSTEISSTTPYRIKSKLLENSHNCKEIPAENLMISSNGKEFVRFMNYDTKIIIDDFCPAGYNIYHEFRLGIDYEGLDSGKYEVNLAIESEQC